MAAVIMGELFLNSSQQKVPLIIKKLRQIAGKVGDTGIPK
jgi:hypothetical protein